jgi:hypothetical protein
MSQREQESFVRAQIASVAELLADVPTHDVIGRPGLEHRLQELRAELETLNRVPRAEPAIVELTFRGAPVVGSHGIEASFAAKIISAFRTTISTIAADIEGRLTAETGRLPTTDRMLITGCALGSFGFRLEEADPQILTEEPSLVSQSIRQAKAILAGCATSDEALADALGDAAPRVLNPIREFLTCLKNADATCTMALPNERFQLQNANEIEQALERASAEVEEETITANGVLRGVLPDTRKFEFRHDDGTLFAGKIDRTVEDPESLIAFQRQPCSATILIRKVGRVRLVRRYVLRGVTARA